MITMAWTFCAYPHLVEFRLECKPNLAARLIVHAREWLRRQSVSPAEHSCRHVIRFAVFVQHRLVYLA